MAAITKKTMPYVRLGNSGLKVSKIILGTMQYGSTSWQEWVIEDQDKAIEHIKFAYENGIQTFDTANVYSNGLSEQILGKAIKKLRLPREEIVVMTKLYFSVVPQYDGNLARTSQSPQEMVIINQRGLSRKNIFDAVKKSLERLQLDYVDLLQCHRFDYETPIEETMHALHDVVKAGHARYIGMSSCHAYQFHAMQNYAISNNLTPFVAMQNHHSLIYREEEREMFPTLKMFGVGAIPWSPLARGLLTRPVGEQTRRAQTDRYQKHYTDNPGTVDIISRVDELAKKKGISMAQVAIAWSLSKPGVTAPIVGTTSLENLKDIIGAVHVQLTEDEIKYLEEPYRPLAIDGHA
ncbi:Putative aryl-alcohol dehydrogenase [Sparassis crispa]|uniref:Aryl-alcohol dehydrogenase n=1 Tax=Sparassis crispa TaxID=139825 RepID=A0A401GL29_9APHY|nr:Putative aryl-alcohol dehydrogenase [Sparassis crispa]GBE82852.1 Putative aryl-alcohol dehydrogenase [Sparassis crispa]